MKNKTKENKKSNDKSNANENLKYIIITIIIIVAFFGVNKMLASNNISLPAILFRSATTNNGGAEDITKKGLDYYMENYGSNVDPSLVEAKRVSFGCHFEIHIYKEGKLVMKLGYAGKIYEL
ncbi:MAG: hypothetical protein FD141_1391 [Fusobacteria bacterium]|nr:MAG: hypothetical protein FD141_1391 [Fusobacteriota bacterium]KAF0230104.1 MAG: hypothetical protein FD182_494 [Fusobacteriota bacterium]